jgi:hypothetical protein
LLVSSELVAAPSTGCRDRLEAASAASAVVEATDASATTIPADWLSGRVRAAAVLD